MSINGMFTKKRKNLREQCSDRIYGTQKLELSCNSECCHLQKMKLWQAFLTWSLENCVEYCELFKQLETNVNTANVRSAVIDQLVKFSEIHNPNVPIQKQYRCKGQMMDLWWMGNKLTEKSVVFISGLSFLNACVIALYSDIWKWLLPMGKWPWVLLDLLVHVKLHKPLLGSSLKHQREKETSLRSWPFGSFWK